MRGSMRAAVMLIKFAELKEKEEQQLKPKVNAVAKKQQNIAYFKKVSPKVRSRKNPCQAKNLKLCSICSDVLVSQCSNTKCRASAEANDKKVAMLIFTPIFTRSAISQKVMKDVSSDENNSKSDDDLSSLDDDEVENTGSS